MKDKKNIFDVIQKLEKSSDYLDEQREKLRVIDNSNAKMYETEFCLRVEEGDNIVLTDIKTNKDEEWILKRVNGKLELSKDIDK